MKETEALVLERVSLAISRYSMFIPGQRVGVAVSGGADSVCLLHALHELAPSLGISLTVLHLNHGLRGEESDADADFARELARKLHLPFECECLEAGALAGNLEQAGRQARREFFIRSIGSGTVDRVATGHTASDQAETVLYRLLRGSGTAGLAGVLPVTREGIVRPLLLCQRSEVLAYLNEQGLNWREDRTNQDLRFVRNWIRHRLMPILVNEFSGAVPGVLASAAGMALDEEEYWKEHLDGVEKALLHPSDGAILLKTEDVLRLAPAVRRRLLRRAIQIVKGDLTGVGLEHIDQIIELCRQAEGHGRMQAPGLDVFRSFEWLRIGLRRPESRRERDYSLDLQPPAQVNVPGTNLRILLEVINRGSPRVQVNEYNDISLLDIDRLPGSLKLRNWRPGDRYQPRGGADGKIKQFFQRDRIPIWDRQGWPVITSAEKIVWVKQFGIAANVAPFEGSRTLLRITEQLLDKSPESNGSLLASLERETSLARGCERIREKE